MRAPLSNERAYTISRLVFEPESTFCEYCGKKFPPARKGHRFCSHTCAAYSTRYPKEKK